MATQGSKAERKLQNAHCDGGKNRWAWDKLVALHKEQYTIMENHADYGYSGVDDGTKVPTFSKESKVLS